MPGGRRRFGRGMLTGGVAVVAAAGAASLTPPVEPATTTSASGARVTTSLRMTPPVGRDLSVLRLIRAPHPKGSACSGPAGPPCPKGREAIDVRGTGAVRGIPESAHARAVPLRLHAHRRGGRGGARLLARTGPQPTHPRPRQAARQPHGGMMDSFAEQIAAGLSPSSVPAEPPAGLVEDILRDVRRGRRLRQAGTALAVVLLLAAAGLGAARFGPGRRDAVRADPLAALTGAARAERYPTPAGATVLAFTPSGTALAVSGGAQKTLWLLRPDGNWTVLDHGHSRVADWATDGTLVAWTWTAKDERGWKCLDRPDGTPVTLTLDPTGYQRMFADQGHLVYGY